MYPQARSLVRSEGDGRSLTTLTGVRDRLAETEMVIRDRAWQEGDQSEREWEKGCPCGASWCFFLQGTEG